MWLRGLNGFVAVAVIGLVVGWVELGRRYRDSPFRILSWPATWLYLGSNALAAVLALLVVRVLDWNFKLEGDAQEVVAVLASGFGAMVIFRSRVFSAARPQSKEGQVEQLASLAVLFEGVLGIADREAGRKQAEERWDLLNNANLSWEDAKLKAAVILKLMPLNEERKKLAANLRALDHNAENLPDHVRATAAVAAVIDAAGPRMARRMLETKSFAVGPGEPQLDPG